MPRILCIIAILFISMFALDAFEPGLTIRKQLAAFAIHLVPSFILLALLILAWEKELAGGIAFLLIGLATSPFIFNHNFRMNNSLWISLSVILMTTLPFALIGVLFILNHFRKKKNRSLHQ